MGDDINTAKVEKIVTQALMAHQAGCPAVKAVGDALQDHKEATTAALHGIRDSIRDQGEANREAYHQTELKLLKGDAEFEEHERRLGNVEYQVESSSDHGPRLQAVENVTRHITTEMEYHQRQVSKFKDRMLVALLKIIVYLLLGASGGVSIAKAFGLL